MGTITIKNQSTLTDRVAALIAAEYWNDQFTVVDIDTED